MHIMPVSGASQAPQRRKSRRAVAKPIKTETIAAHDPTLLVAALEDIESKRLALESLLDAGVLWQGLTQQ